MFLNHHICQVHLKTHRPQPHWHCPPGLCVWHPALWVGAQQEPAKVDRESFSSKQPRHLANSVQGITRSQLHGKFYKALFAPETIILACSLWPQLKIPTYHLLPLIKGGCIHWSHEAVERGPLPSALGWPLYKPATGGRGKGRGKGKGVLKPHRLFRPLKRVAGTEPVTASNASPKPFTSHSPMVHCISNGLSWRLWLFHFEWIRYISLYLLPVTFHLPHKTQVKKLYMYSGHDTTVAPILHTLDIFNGIAPPYCSMIIFELFEQEGLQVNANMVSFLFCYNFSPYGRWRSRTKTQQTLPSPWYFLGVPSFVLLNNSKVFYELATFDFKCITR